MSKRRVVAIEIEDGDEVIRYASGWGLKEVRRWAASPQPVPTVELKSPLCKCGHSEAEHLPGCIYTVEGCECEGYEKAAEVGTPVVRPIP
jgi:hypothetical protein